MADSKNVKNAVKKKVKGKVKSKAKKAAKKAGKAILPQIMPFILLLVALFLLIFFSINLFALANDYAPGDHALVGNFGTGLSNIFFGIFGIMAMTVPVALGFFALFWKRLSEDGKAISKTVLASTSIVLAATLFHVVQTLIWNNGDFVISLPELYNAGTTLSGGGVIGGVLGWLFELAMGPVIAIIMLTVIVGVLVCYLFGLKLHVYIGKLADLIKYKWDHKGSKPKKTKKKAVAYEDDDDDADYDDVDDEEEIPAKPIKINKKKPIASDTIIDDDDIIDSSDSTSKNDVKGDDIDLDDEDYGEDIPVSAFGKKTAKKSDGIKLDDDDEDVEDEIEDNDASKINLDDDDFIDDIIFDGQTHKIDKTTGEVVPDDGIIIDDGETRYEPEIVDEDNEPVYAEYKFPPIDLLKKAGLKTGTSPEEIEENKQKLREVLESFKIKVKEISCSCGPTITRYEIKPDAGVRVKAIANLVDDIAMALATSGVRIEAPIPGKAAVGVEVPNHTRSTVFLRTLIEAPEFQNHKSKIASCLGADVSGRPVVFDIEKMPHLLVAGTTGSGKSVCINTIITSLLYRAKPEEVKLVLIDPKKVEFNVYRDIPHLSCKIVTDPKKAAGALNSAVNEMEKRFELIEEVGVRNITGYNEITKNDPDKPFMPRMVIIIDELADLMMTAPDEVETAICRIAQKARAAGIHLILGTQRPSVDVITGLIKANIPSRIAFTVTSSVDSRTIIDIGGAEKLIGMGDMLYAPVGSPKPQRVQGSFVSDGEVESIVEFIKNNNAPVRYDCEFEKSIDEEAAKCGNPAGKKSSAAEDAKVASSGDEDPKLYDAIELAIEAGKISTSLLQRKCEVGYGRAAKIIDRMEELGYVGPIDGNKPRKILITAEEWAEKKINDNNDEGIFD